MYTHVYTYTYVYIYTYIYIHIYRALVHTRLSSSEAAMENGVEACLDVDILKASLTSARLAVPQAGRISQKSAP